MRSDRDISSNHRFAPAAAIGERLQSPVVIDIHAMARRHRAMILGELLADGIIWLVRLPDLLLQRAAAGRPALQRFAGRRCP